MQLIFYLFLIYVPCSKHVKELRQLPWFKIHYILFLRFFD